VSSNLLNDKIYLWDLLFKSLRSRCNQTFHKILDISLRTGNFFCVAHQTRLLERRIFLLFKKSFSWISEIKNYLFGLKPKYLLFSSSHLETRGEKNIKDQHKKKVLFNLFIKIFIVDLEIFSVCWMEFQFIITQKVLNRAQNLRKSVLITRTISKNKSRSNKFSDFRTFKKKLGFDDFHSSGTFAIKSIFVKNIKILKVIRWFHKRDIPLMRLLQTLISIWNIWIINL